VITASFRVALAAAALAAALWLIPASIHIASWPASGPIRIAYLAPLARLWLLVALSGAGAAVLVLIARRRGASIDDVAASV
jgi:hypothetical protein